MNPRKHDKKLASLGGQTKQRKREIFIASFANRKGCQATSNHIVFHEVTSEKGNQKRHSDTRTQGAKRERESNRCNCQAGYEEVVA